MTNEEANLARIRLYFESLARGATGGELAEHFTPDVIQEEFPSRLRPNWAVRDLKALQEGAARGRAFMKDDCFDPW